MEQASEVQIRVAVCDESGAFQELLAAYDGLVVFEQYESDAAVQRAVQRGDAECGYVLPETLAAKMTAQHARREILVYQDADAVAVPVVNEILFERIFRQVSCKWFEEYLLQNSVIQKAYGGEAHLRERVTALFHEELTAGTTFRFEIRRIGTLDKAAADDPTVYPVYWGGYSRSGFVCNTGNLASGSRSCSTTVLQTKQGGRISMDVYAPYDVGGFVCCGVDFATVIPSRIACFGQPAAQAPQRIHSAEFGAATGSTSILQVRAHFPHWMQDCLSTSR